MPIAIVEYPSGAAAGIVHVELGFVPDFAWHMQGHGGTNPNFHYWVNNARFSSWAAGLDLLLTGSSGIVTRDTTGITAYAGGDTVATTETADTAGKHVDRAGAPATAGHVTAPGLSIPVDHQTSGGRNVLIALRADL